MLPRSLINFKIQKYQNKPKFNVFYSRNNLRKGWGICNKSWWVQINRDLLIAFYVNGDNVTYFDSFGIGHIPAKFIGNKNITNIYRIQANDSIMCGYFSIGFIDFVLKGKSLLNYINLISPNEYENNDNIIRIYFQ